MKQKTSVYTPQQTGFKGNCTSKLVIVAGTTARGVQNTRRMLPSVTADSYRAGVMAFVFSLCGSQKAKVRDAHTLNAEEGQMNKVCTHQTRTER